MTLPRFSLRLLLVAVAVLCAWLAWERSVVMERNRVLARFGDEPGISILMADAYAPTPLDPTPRASVPWIRSLLGDVAVQTFFFAGKPRPHELQAIKRSFPEATVEEIWGAVDGAALPAGP